MTNKQYIKLIQNIILVTLLFAVVVFLLALTYKSLLLNTDISSEIYSEAVVESINKERVARGLHPLVLDEELQSAAELKAKDMASKGYFSHNAPDGRTPWQFIDQAGYSYLYAGENLAVDFTDTTETVEAWMDSPGHKKNILNIDFAETGVAVVNGTYDGRETLYFVQMFGRPYNSDSLASDFDPQVLGATTDNPGSTEYTSNVVNYEESNILAILTNPNMSLKRIFYALSFALFLIISFSILLWSRKFRDSIYSLYYGFGAFMVIWGLFYLYNLIEFSV